LHGAAFRIDDALQQKKKRAAKNESDLEAPQRILLLGPRWLPTPAAF